MILYLVLLKEVIVLERAALKALLVGILSNKPASLFIEALA